MSNKSLICPIGQDKFDLTRAYNEVETFATLKGASDISKLHLRLISEELISMICSLTEVEEGQFFVECDNDAKEFSLHLSANTLLFDKVKETLVKVSSSNKNDAYKGFSGLLRRAIDAVSSPSNVIITSEMSTQVSQPISGVYYNECNLAEWSLNKFIQNETAKKTISEWDELEMSILKKLSKEIKVSARSNNIDIVVYYEVK